MCKEVIFQSKLKNIAKHEDLVLADPLRNLHCSKNEGALIDRSITPGQIKVRGINLSIKGAFALALFGSFERSLHSVHTERANPGPLENWDQGSLASGAVRL